MWSGRSAKPPTFSPRPRSAGTQIGRSCGDPDRGRLWRGDGLGLQCAAARAEVLVNGERWSVVRPKMSDDELIGLDRIPDWLAIAALSGASRSRARPSCGSASGRACGRRAASSAASSRWPCSAPSRRCRASSMRWSDRGDRHRDMFLYRSFRGFRFRTGRTARAGWSATAALRTARSPSGATSWRPAWVTPRRRPVAGACARHAGAPDRLKLAIPRASLAKRDPYVLRYAVLLLLAAGLVIAGSDAGRRLAGAFSLGQAAPLATLRCLDRSPRLYRRAADLSPAWRHHDVAVPAGSILHCGCMAAIPRRSLLHARKARAVIRGTGRGLCRQGRITADTSVGVRAGSHTLGAWQLKAIPDEPPSIAFAQPPSRTERDAVKFAFTAGDDYGVTAARASSVRSDRAANSAPWSSICRSRPRRRR